jgi:hypothetical protein
MNDSVVRPYFNLPIPQVGLMRSDLLSLPIPTLKSLTHRTFKDPIWINLTRLILHMSNDSFSSSQKEEAFEQSLLCPDRSGGDMYRFTSSDLCESSTQYYYGMWSMIEEWVTRNENENENEEQSSTITEIKSAYQQFGKSIGLVSTSSSSSHDPPQVDFHSSFVETKQHPTLIHRWTQLKLDPDIHVHFLLSFFLFFVTLKKKKNACYGWIE